MRKLKNKFKKDLVQTQKMKAASTHLKEGNFMGAYRYKDYLIFHSIVKGANYCSISREGKKEVSENIIKEVAEYFIGKNYEITPNVTLNGVLQHVVNIWEVKDNERYTI
ncbi:MAG: hypothetical protein Q4P79_02980 [Fusobacterium sp.]|nr:hypothetical protein [Fusobacterium sp.]MDO5788405.1 hypothetical protein [Fusobacterium sp.]